MSANNVKLIRKLLIIFSAIIRTKDRTFNYLKMMISTQKFKKDVIFVSQVFFNIATVEL